MKKRLDQKNYFSSSLTGDKIFRYRSPIEKIKDKNLSPDRSGKIVKKKLSACILVVLNAL